MLYHHSYYGVSPLPLPNVISFTTTISTTSASLYHSCFLDHCFFGLPLFVWTTTTLWIATIFLDYRCIYVSNKAVCDPNFRFLISQFSMKILNSQWACMHAFQRLRMYYGGKIILKFKDLWESENTGETFVIAISCSASYLKKALKNSFHENMHGFR